MAGDRPGRKRKWDSPAHRQQVLRERQREQNDLVRWLHMAIQRLARDGSALYINPHDVLGETPYETLQKLEKHVR